MLQIKIQHLTQYSQIHSFQLKLEMTNLQKHQNESDFLYTSCVIHVSIINLQ